MRLYNINTDKLVSWLIPIQLSGGILFAFLKQLCLEVKKSFETVYRSPVEIATAHWYFYVQPPEVYLVSVWQGIERLWRVNSSVLIYRIACTGILGTTNQTPLTGRYVINHEALGGAYVRQENDWLAWWDNTEKYLRIQEFGQWGTNDWFDSRLFFKDGINLALPGMVLLEEKTVDSQLMQLSLISEAVSLPKWVTIGESEPDADVTFAFNKAKWTYPVATGPSSFIQVYYGDDYLIDKYNKVLAGMRPFQQFGRTFKIELV